MGLFFPSNQREELDPAWQKRRQRLFGLIGFIGLAVALVAVWYFGPLGPDHKSSRDRGGNSVTPTGEVPPWAESEPED